MRAYDVCYWCKKAKPVSTLVPPYTPYAGSRLSLAEKIWRRSAQATWEGEFANDRTWNVDFGQPGDYFPGSHNSDRQCLMGFAVISHMRSEFP